MMMSRHIIVLCLTLSLLAAGCKDDEPSIAPIDQLPPATQSGAYTFGCLVNGEAFVPESTRDITCFYQGGVLFIGADVEDENRDQGVGFVLENQPVGQQPYELISNISKGARFINSDNDCYYDFKDIIRGTLTITHFDDVNYIISGNFEFITAIESCDTIRVTNGRFDLPYIP